MTRSSVQLGVMVHVARRYMARCVKMLTRSGDSHSTVVAIIEDERDVEDFLFIAEAGGVGQ